MSVSDAELDRLQADAPDGYTAIRMTRWTCLRCGNSWEDSYAITARCDCGEQMDPTEIAGLRAPAASDAPATADAAASGEKQPR